jgi:hypothetical protein
VAETVGDDAVLWGDEVRERFPGGEVDLSLILLFCPACCDAGWHYYMFDIQNVNAHELPISFPRSLYRFAVFRKDGELGRVYNSAVNAYGVLFLVLRMSEKERVEAMESNSHMAVKGFWKHNKAPCDCACSPDWQIGASSS